MPEFRGGNRYELKEPLGQGGMGVVYRAYDVTAKREVALKTIRDIRNQGALDLFRKECDIQKSLNHPNIVDLYDIGEFEEKGRKLPYFVMPLLRGNTLDKLTRDSSARLTVERCIGILTQICRGLQAAHDHGLVHRDLKPSNIFVLEDDSVKIIDFGVAHLADKGSTVGMKGTLLYMSPEQLQNKKLTSQSDIFSLGVVCYETLTRRNPFERATAEEVIEAIVNQFPPPASEINPQVSGALSQVIHVAMAKQPIHRYSSCKELAEVLQKAFRNEPIERFDAAKVEPRLDRARKALQDGEHEFASEILNELQAEGHLHPDLIPLQRQINQTLRERTIGKLLESARRRVQEQEYQLALQKVQEILDIDPNNADALALRARIEDKRSTDQIGEWLRLARQHIDNRAYKPAHDALQRILESKPRETSARQLLDELEEKEQEDLRARQEMEQLYQSAMEAKHKGDVSGALKKLGQMGMDRKSAIISPDRDATYRSFYDQVRSEYDSLNAALAEARKFLSDREFRKALAICNEWLAKYSSNALLQALKFDIEESQRKEFSAYVARIDRDVEAEPHLDRKVSILTEALENYPSEHFERALRSSMEKRDLVERIVAEVRNLEERSLYSEALEKWATLRTIYSQYPGLAFEIERLEKRRDQQARAQAMARWVDQIERLLGQGDFGKAKNLAESALTEFPDDEDLLALVQKASEGIERRSKAQQLLEEGQSHCSGGRLAEGLEVLRRAYTMDDRNPQIRTALVEGLVSRTRIVIDSDWRSADALIQEALQLDPGNILAESLGRMIKDRKRAEIIEQRIAQSKQAEKEDNLVGALEHVESGLLTDSNDPTLIQRRDRLKKSLEEQRTQTRHRELDELKTLIRNAESVTDAAQRETFLNQAQGLAEKHQEDREFDTLFGDMKLSMTMAGAPAPVGGETKIEPAKPVAQSVVEPLVKQAAPEKKAQPQQTKKKEPAKQAAPPSPPSPPPLPALVTEQPEPSRKKKAVPAPAAARKIAVPVWVWAVGGVALLAIAFVLFRKAAPPPANMVAVEIRTSPPGASVRVNGEEKSGQNPLSLEPGKTYTIEASLDGYETAVKQDVAISEQFKGPIEFTLQPAKQGLRLSTNFASGSVFLDDQPVGQLQQDGQFSIEKVEPGKHTLKVTGSGSQEAVVAFEMAPGNLAVVSDHASAKDLNVVLLSNFQNRGRLYSNLAPVPLTLDGQLVGDVQAGNGLDLPNFGRGAHELVLGQGNKQNKMMVDVGSASGLLVSVMSPERNSGNIKIAANEDGVQVFLDNKLRPARRQGSDYWIYNVEAKPAAIRVVKDGFTVAPGEQQVQVVKGETVSVAFTLTKVGPTTATLRITDAERGTRVTVDGGEAQLQADGSLTVNAGEHTVELSKDGYEAKSHRLQFKAGETVSLNGSLDAAVGKVTVGSRNPANARIALRRREGGSEIVITDRDAEAPAGDYTLVATASGYEELRKPVRIRANATSPAGDINLTPLTLPTCHMECWENQAAWRSENGWYTRKGGGVVLAKSVPSAGTFSFTARPKGGIFGGGRVQWVVNYLDPRNYDLFQIDKDKVYWKRFTDGKASPEKQGPHRVDIKNDQYQLRIEVRSDEVVQTVYDGKDWKLLPRLADSGRNFSEGKFGLFVPGNDDLWLTNFEFAPSR